MKLRGLWTLLGFLALIRLGAQDSTGTRVPMPGLPTPPNWKTEVTYDPVTGFYILQRSVSGMPVGAPRYLTAADYQALRFRELESDFWQKRWAQNAGGTELNGLVAQVNHNTLRRFGPDSLDSLQTARITVGDYGQGFVGTKGRQNHPRSTGANARNRIQQNKNVALQLGYKAIKQLGVFPVDRARIGQFPEGGQRNVDQVAYSTAVHHHVGRRFARNGASKMVKHTWVNAGDAGIVWTFSEELPW